MHMAANLSRDWVAVDCDMAHSQAAIRRPKCSISLTCHIQATWLET